MRSPAAIVSDIRARRAILRVVGRPHRRRGPLPRQKQPDSIRLSYFRALLDVLAQAKQLVERAEPRLRAFVERAASARGDGIRTDAHEDDPNEIFDELSEGFFREFDTERLTELARQYAIRTSEFQREQLRRQIKNAMGVDVVQAEPWLEPKIVDFARENVALIKSVPTQYFAELEKSVAQGMRSGVRWEEIASDMEDRYGVAENRAKLIARDQVGKMAAEVNQARQEDLGVKRFIWRTSNDNRVRDSHVELEGKTFDWDDPPIVDGEPATPGSPVQCRCEAQPVLDELLGAVDEE